MAIPRCNQDSTCQPDGLFIPPCCWCLSALACVFEADQSRQTQRPFPSLSDGRVLSQLGRESYQQPQPIARVLPSVSVILSPQIRGSKWWWSLQPDDHSSRTSKKEEINYSAISPYLLLLFLRITRKWQDQGKILSLRSSPEQRVKSLPLSSSFHSFIPSPTTFNSPSPLTRARRNISYSHPRCDLERVPFPSLLPRFCTQRVLSLDAAAGHVDSLFDNHFLSLLLKIRP